MLIFFPPDWQQVASNWHYEKRKKQMNQAILLQKRNEAILLFANICFFCEASRSRKTKKNWTQRAKAEDIKTTWEMALKYEK